MKFKIQIFEHVPIKRPSDDPEEDDRKPAAKRIKKEPEDDAQSVTQDEPELENVVKPWEDKKDYEAIFRKHIYILEMMVKNIMT